MIYFISSLGDTDEKNLQLEEVSLVSLLVHFVTRINERTFTLKYLFTRKSESCVEDKKFKLVPLLIIVVPFD